MKRFLPIFAVIVSLVFSAATYLTARAEIRVMNKHVRYQNKLLRDQNDRLAFVESHFRGHKITFTKNGDGMEIAPCQLGTPNCFKDSTGITLDHITIKGMQRAGLYMDQSELDKPIPHSGQ